MSKTKVTLYLDEDVALRLRIKAAEIGGQGVQSRLANQYIKDGLGMAKPKDKKDEGEKE